MKVFMNETIDYYPSVNGQQSRIIAAVWTNNNKIFSVYIKKVGDRVENAFVYNGNEGIVGDYPVAISAYVMSLPAVQSIIGDNIDRDEAIIIEDYRKAFADALKTLQ